MAISNLTNPELTPQDHKDIHNEVARFESLYQERYGDMTPLQRANLTRAYQIAVEYGIGLECPADAIMTWGVHTGLTYETQCLAPIYRARYPRSTKAPTGEDLKFLREELEAAKWRFCPDVYGNGVYVFAGEIVGDC